MSRIVESLYRVSGILKESAGGAFDDPLVLADYISSRLSIPNRVEDITDRTYPLSEIKFTLNNIPGKISVSKESMFSSPEISIYYEDKKNRPWSVTTNYRGDVVITRASTGYLNVYGYTLQPESKAKVDEFIMKFNEMIDTAKLKIQDDEIDGFPELAKTLKMEYHDVAKKVGDVVFHSMFSREAMSYGNGFKHKDIFTSDNHLKKLGGDDVRKVWRYKPEPEILLVHTPGFNFLTTIDQYLKDLGQE